MAQALKLKAGRQASDSVGTFPKAVSDGTQDTWMEIGSAVVVCVRMVACIVPLLTMDALMVPILPMCCCLPLTTRDYCALQLHRDLYLH